jgi:hypothetical protein
MENEPHVRFWSSKEILDMILYVVSLSCTKFEQNYTKK